MVLRETLLNYPDWSKPFDTHTDASDKQLGAVISQDGKPIAFFSRRLSKAQRNYTTTEKELLSIVECLKQFRGILFGYKINVFSDHKNLDYAATVSESQRVMRWRLILGEFGPNIQHIAGINNVVADMLSHVPSANCDQDELEPSNAQHHAKELFALEVNTANDDGFPLLLSKVFNEQQKELNNNKSKIKALLENKKSGYVSHLFEGHTLIMYEDKIYVPQSLRGRTLEWYHYYLNHPGGDHLANTLLQVCYWKGLTHQAKQFAKESAMPKIQETQGALWTSPTQRYRKIKTMAYCSCRSDRSIHSHCKTTTTGK
jgi:hypothetical protein